MRQPRCALGPTLKHSRWPHALPLPGSLAGVVSPLVLTQVSGLMPLSTQALSTPRDASLPGASHTFRTNCPLKRSFGCHSVGETGGREQVALD